VESCSAAPWAQEAFFVFDAVLQYQRFVFPFTGLVVHAIDVSEVVELTPEHAKDATGVKHELSHRYYTLVKFVVYAKVSKGRNSVQFCWWWCIARIFSDVDERFAELRIDDCVYWRSDL
jgi:hypothetical protein